MDLSVSEDVASPMVEPDVAAPVNDEHVVAAVDSEDHPIALNESAPHRDLAEGASIDTGDTVETGASSGQEVGENGEPAAKRHKLDVVVPEDYVDEEEDFPADWKGEVEEDEDDDDEGFAITLGDTRPRIDVRKNLRKGGIDFNDVPEINGVPVTEFNVDTLEDKPWKKPGADLSDYFNYGFNEDTWRMYCDKQRNMRSEAHRLEHAHNQISTVSKNDNSKYGGPGGPGDEAPFRAQFRRRPNQDGGILNQAGRERLLNPMMMRPGMMMMPGGMHGPGMMHPMGAPMNPMMMRPMNPMSMHAVPPPMRQQEQHNQQRRDQHGPDMGGFRRNLATLTRIDTSGSQGDGSAS